MFSKSAHSKKPGFIGRNRIVAELLRVFFVFGRSYAFSGLTPHLHPTGV
jgi:hypothetical protein